MQSRSAQEIWEAALGELQLQITKANYQTWLKDTTGMGWANGQFVVGVPGVFAAEWLDKRLRSLVKKTLIGITGQDLDVQFRVAGTTPGLKPRPSQDSTSTGLNPRYTFDCFVVGSCNRLAHAAALGAAKGQGKGYNPLFIYGEAGLGKTHLLQAIGHVALASGLRLLYVSSEQFTNEFINAIRERKTEEFCTKYRSVDMLLVDDIHFIGDKRRTQEAFFHTFNELHNANRQMVMTSDRSPKSMPLLEDRLCSRFEWGLVAQIEPPDLETRLALLRAKASERGAAIGQEALEFIAQRARQNIRELEGCLNQVMAYARLTGADPTPELAAQALSAVTPELVIAAVAGYFQLAPETLSGKKRDSKTALCRQIAMYLLRGETGLPLTQIGQWLGGRADSTVIHGCEKVAQALDDNPRLRRDIQEIRSRLYHHRA